MPTDSPSKTEPGSRRRRAPRTAPGVRREHLLDVAESILGSQGSDAVRMDHVARTAGVTRPVVYEHFSNRDELIIALLERHGDRLRENELSEPIGRASFPEFLGRATRAYLHTALQHGPAMRALVSGERLSPAIELTRRRVWDSGASRWAGLYGTHFNLPPKSAMALAVSHLAGLSALAALCMDGALDVDDAIELHVTSSLGALAAVSEELTQQ